MDRARRVGGTRGFPSRRGWRASLNRGTIYDVELSGGRRPVVVLTRDRAIPLLSQVVVAMVTGTVRGLPTEVPVGREHGLDRESVINCDNLFTVSKHELETRRGDLDLATLDRLRRALRVALDLN